MHGLKTVIYLFRSICWDSRSWGEGI